MEKWHSILINRWYKKDTDATSIFVYGNNIYIGGYEYTDDSKTNSVAKLWINGSVHNLSDGTKTTIIYSVFVYEGNIYAAGYEYDSSKDASIPVYWVNLNRYNLENYTNNKHTFARSIFVYDNNIYIAGEESDRTNPTTIRRALYWKNGNKFVLEESDTNIFTINSIFVRNNNIYIAGQTYDGVNSRIKYWKNSIEESIPTNFNSGIYSIYVTESNDVYLAGVEYNAIGYAVAKYWKNKFEVPISDGQQHGRAYSIFVK